MSPSQPGDTEQLTGIGLGVGVGVIVGVGVGVIVGVGVGVGTGVGATRSSFRMVTVLFVLTGIFVAELKRTIVNVSFPSGMKSPQIATGRSAEVPAGERVVKTGLPFASVTGTDPDVPM